MYMNTNRSELPVASDVPSILKKNDNDRETDCNEMSDELFSDEPDADDTICHSPDIFEVTDDNCSSLASIKTPLLYSSVQNTTPDCTAITRAPLSLIPFLSNINESWSCDLETPQAKRKEQIYVGTVVDEVVSSLASPEKIVCLKQYAPVDSSLKNVDSEYACTSPILNSRKVRRRPKRRILKLSTSVDLVHAAKLDQPAAINVSEDNHLSTNVEECTGNINNGGNDVILRDTILDKTICDTDEKAVLNDIDVDTIVYGVQMCPSGNLRNDSAVQCYDYDRDRVAILDIENSKDRNKIDDSRIKIPSERSTLNSKSIFYDVNRSDEDSTSTAQINYLTQGINAVDKTCLEADEGCKDIIDSGRNSLGFNDNGVVTEMNPASKDFFGDVSFSSIDNICQSDIDQRKKETVDWAIINNTEVGIKNVSSENSECIRQNNISNETKSNGDDVKCTRVSLENDVFDRGANSSMKFPSDSGVLAVSNDRDSLVDRVKDIKRLLNSRRQTAELKSVDIPVEDFTKEVSALEKVVTPSKSKNNKYSIQSQSGFVPFSKFCLLENENAKLDAADKSRNDLPIDIVATNKGVNEYETKIVESLISTTENFKDSPELQDKKNIDVNSPLSNVSICCECEPRSAVDVECTSECISQTLVSAVKDSLNSSGTSEALTRNTSASLSLEENNDICIVVENDGVTDSEIWKLGEMALVIANDVEDFSEWEYKSNDTSQKLSQQINIRANKTLSIDSKVNETESKKYVEVQCNKEISEQIQRMNDFGDSTGNTVKINEKPIATDHLTNSTQCEFLTISGKDMAIDDDRPCAAKEIFKDIEGVDCENAKVLDINGPLNVTGENRNVDSKERGVVTETVELVQCGFSTASGKAVSVSKRNLCAAEKFYEGIDDSDYFGKENCSVNSSNLLKTNSWPTLNKGNKFTRDRRIHSRRALQNKTFIATEDADANKSILLPIKNVDVTVKGRQKIRDTLLNVNKVVGLQNAFTECKSKRKHEESNAGLERLPMLDSLGGFVTAGGKSLTVSDRALKRAKYCFQDDDTLNVPVSGKNLSFGEMSTDRYFVKNEPNTRQYRVVKTISKEFDVFYGFSFEDLEMSNSLATKVKSILNNQDISEFEQSRINFNSTNNLSQQLTTECCVPKRDTLVSESNTLKSVVRKALPEFSTASGKSVVVTDDILCKVKTTCCETSQSRMSEQILNTNHSEIVNLNEIAIENNSPENMEKQELCNSLKTSCVGFNFDTAESTNIGFSTASGKKLNISNKALSKARLLFADEKIPITSSCREQISKETSVNMTNINSDINVSQETVPKTETLSLDKLENIRSIETPKRSSLNVKNKCIDKNETKTVCFGFATAAGKQINISEDALSKAKTLLSSALEDTRDINYSVKADNTSTVTPGSITRSNTILSELEPLSKRKIEDINDNTPLGRYRASKFKRVRLSDEFQVRKLFTEDTDCSKEKSKVEDRRMRNCREALWSTSDCTFVEKNDRARLPRCYLQKSFDNVESAVTDIPRHSDIDNSDKGISIKFCKDRKPLISDEVMASTVALLADENDSNDGVHWSSGFTCNSTVVEDRHVNTWPIALDENDDITLEGSPSPILRRRDRFNLHKRTAKSNLKDLGRNSAEESGGTNRSDRIVNSCGGEMKNVYLETEMDRNFDEFVNITEKRLAAALEQDKVISAKKWNKPKPIKGSLLTTRDVNRETRISWRQLTGGVAPVPHSHRELVYRQIGTEILKITAATAATYKFRCTEFYGVDAVRNVHGLDVGDGARLILDENNCASISEFIRSFMASPGVDPALLPNGWVENHYRWIVWKLASIDRMKFGSIVMPRMLTPGRVMKELKYRYDREIDKSQRSALRRILEKDDSACRRLILCVASIAEQREHEDAEKASKTLETSRWKVELTDGWYSIPACIDAAMTNHISSGKVLEGTKLVICGAELMNCDQGCSPLEIPTGVCLRIHTNSTRRARWYAKLGYQACAGPIPTTLKAIDPNGGQIGKLIVTVARVYPILYRERTQDDQLIFRNAKCEEKAAMAYERECQSRADAIYSKVRADLEMPKEKCSDSSETDSMDMDANAFCDEAGLSDSQRQKLMDRHYAKEKKFQQELESKLRQSLPLPRQVTPLLRIRVVDCERLTAIVKVWTGHEEVLDIFKEGNRISICNLYASGRRTGELQLTAGRHALFNREASNNNVTCPRRTFTHLSDITATGIDPPFGEFDTVGIVSSVEFAPNGMKNLEVAYLACPNSDSLSSSYLSIFFWQGIAAHGYSDIISVGSAISCSNLEWRRSTLCGIPTAYCTDRTVFTRNPRQNHLRVPFDDLNSRIENIASYAAKCASDISLEIAKRSALSRTPGQETPIRSLLSSDKLTPGSVPRTSRSRTPMDHNSSAITPAKSSIQRRLDKLYWYGEPPELSPIVVNNSSDKVMQDFRPLFCTPDRKSSIVDLDGASHNSESCHQA